MRLAVVTATTNVLRALDCIDSWLGKAVKQPAIFVVRNGLTARDIYEREYVIPPVTLHYVEGYLGSVPAFEIGVNEVLDKTDAEIIACLHDDFKIDESAWDQKLLRHFDHYPNCGLAGFGGAVGLGETHMYTKPYDPMSLARIGFRSNLIDAEKHGLRSLLPEKVACLDGFSQVGRREFFLGPAPRNESLRPWTFLREQGFVHHFYDGALGCLARRYSWETWYLPLRGQHFGGRTAVGDRDYAEWAKTQHPLGDQGFWQEAHHRGYELFRNELPIRV